MARGASHVRVPKQGRHKAGDKGIDGIIEALVHWIIEALIH